MSFHHDLDKWLFQSKKENCPYCCQEEDPMQSISLKHFKYSKMCAHPHVCMKGTCYLITKEHYVELYDLNNDALLGFMKEVQVAAKILKELTQAIKINYEMHGNTAPHLHMHLFPRHIDDPFAGVSINYNQIAPPVYQGNEFEIFVRAMQERLREIEI